MMLNIAGFELCREIEWAIEAKRRALASKLRARAKREADREDAKRCALAQIERMEQWRATANRENEAFDRRQAELRARGAELAVIAGKEASLKRQIVEVCGRQLLNREAVALLFPEEPSGRIFYLCNVLWLEGKIKS